MFFSVKVALERSLCMYDALCLPNLKCNLFSVKAAAAKDNVIKFGETKCWISGKDGTLFGMETVAEKLHYTSYCKAPCCCCSIQVGQY